MKPIAIIGIGCRFPQANNRIVAVLRLLFVFVQCLD